MADSETQSTPLWKLVPLKYTDTVVNASGDTALKNINKSESKNNADLFKMIPGNDNILPTISSANQNLSGGMSVEAIAKRFCADGEYELLLKKYQTPQMPINIVDDYDWTTSPKEARQKVPRIRLTEKYVYLNNAVSNMAYKMGALGDMIGEAKAAINASGLGDMFKKGKDVVMPESKEKLQQKQENWEKFKANFSHLPDNISLNGIQDIIAKLQNEIKDPKLGSGEYDYSIEEKNASLQNEIDLLNNIIKDGIPQPLTTLEESLLQMYEMWDKFKNKIDNLRDSVRNASTFLGPASHYNYLYWCLFTGFEYYLPYFDNPNKQVDNTFNEAPSVAGAKWYDPFNFASNIMDIGLGGLGAAINVRPSSKGIYVEQPKPFAYPTTGESINIQFPLNNTGTWEDVIRNWQFIYLLLFQNQPSRVNKYRIDWPVIYEVEILNVRFVPYAFISSIKIDYKGVRRKMKMPFYFSTENGPIDYEVIIPEAYDINITITPLTSEPSNFSIPSELITFGDMNKRRKTELANSKYKNAEQNIKDLPTT